MVANRWVRASVAAVAGVWLAALPVSAQQVLTVAAFPAVDAIVKAAIPAFNKRHPHVEVRVVSRQFADHHTAMTTALSTSSNLPDVMALEVGYVGRFAQGNGLEVLSVAPYNLQNMKSRFVPYAYQQGTNGRGEVIAVPSDIGPGTLLYRHDVLEKAGVKVEDLTRSWDSYIESGVRIKDKTGAHLLAHARDLKDLLIRTGLQPGEGLYFDNQSRPLATSPRFVRAFEAAQKVRQAQLDAKVNLWSNEWTEGLRRGTLTTQLSGAWLAGHLNNWLAPSTKGLWRAVDLPEKAAAAYGGTFLAIPRGVAAQKKPMAWELVKHLTLNRDAQLSAFRDQDAFPALVETHTDPFFAESIAFLGGQQARLLWRDAAARIAHVAVHRQDAFAEQVINTELDKVLDQGKSIPLALEDAQRQLQRRATR